MKAILNNYRQSPRKMRLVVSAVKGKTVKEAQVMLSLMPKIATVPLRKLLESAIANAKENNKISDAGALVIKDFRVDGGVVLKRSMPRAHGSAYQILKRTSKVTLVLAERAEVKSEKSKVKSKN
ncbi:MAG: 50S ribosomal protein L22 [bacterium]|nr:50S ribosomal protein L22 [bacterium]